MMMQTQRIINTRGETVEQQVPALTQEQRDQRDQSRALDRVQRQAQVDDAWIAEQARAKRLAADIAADPDLSAHKAAVDAVLAAKPGDVVPALPARPVLGVKV